VIIKHIAADFALWSRPRGSELFNLLNID